MQKNLEAIRHCILCTLQKEIMDTVARLAADEAKV